MFHETFITLRELLCKEWITENISLKIKLVCLYKFFSDHFLRRVIKNFRSFRKISRWGSQNIRVSAYSIMKKASWNTKNLITIEPLLTLCGTDGHLSPTYIPFVFTFSSHTEFVKRESIVIAWVKNRTFCPFDECLCFVCLRRQNKQKKHSVCLSVCLFVRTWTFYVDTITFEGVSGSRQNLVGVFYVWNVGLVLKSKVKSWS